MKSTLTDFQNNIGNRFKVVDGDGKPFHGLLGAHDTIIKVNPETGEVEGDKFIAHFSSCRFIQAFPEHLKSVTKTPTNMRINFNGPGDEDDDDD